MMKLRFDILSLAAAFMLISASCPAQPKIKGPLYLADRVMSTNRISQGGRLAAMKSASVDMSYAREYMDDMAVLNPRAVLYPCLSLACTGRYDEASGLCAGVVPDEYAEIRQLMDAGFSLMAGNSSAYRSAAAAFPHGRFSEYETILDGISRESGLGRSRSPFAAAAMSALIPGAGKIYAGNLREGISAFITVGSLAGITAECIAKKGMGDWRSISLAAVSGLFYAANIYGSYLSVSTTETIIDNARKTAVLFTVGVPLAEFIGR